MNLQYFKGTLFWALFAVAYALLIVCVGIEFYYKGMWSIYRDATSTIDRWRRRIVGDGKSQLCTFCSNLSPHR